MAINPDKNAVEQGLIARLIGKIKRIALDMGDSVSAETSRAQAAEGLKADKVQGATAGNLAALDTNGNLTDSGSKAADFKTKQTPVASPDPSGNSGLNFIDSVSQNENGEVVLHKNTVQSASTTYKGVVKLSNAIDSTSVTEAATPKAVKDAYDELNNKIVARAVFLSQAEWAVQSQLPGDPAKVYYVENGTGEDAYTVYVWKESTSTYEEVDESSIDLDGYWHDSPTTTGSGNVVTNITLGNDGVPQVEKGLTALTQHQDISGKQNVVSTDTDSSAFGDDTAIATGFSSDKLHLNVASRLWNYIRGKILGWYDWTRVDTGTGRYAKICSIADPASGTSYTVDVLVTHMTSYYAVTGLVRITVSHGSSSVQASILASDSSFYAVDSGNPPKVYTYVDGNGKRTFVFDTASAYQTAQGFVFRAVGGFSDKWSFFGDVGCSNDAADLGSIGTKQDALDVTFVFANYAKTAGHAATATSADNATEADSVPWSGVNARPSTMCSPYFDVLTTGRYYKMLSTHGVQTGSSCNAMLNNAFAGFCVSLQFKVYATSVAVDAYFTQLSVYARSIFETNGYPVVRAYKNGDNDIRFILDMGAGYAENGIANCIADFSGVTDRDDYWSWELEQQGYTSVQSSWGTEMTASPFSILKDNTAYYAETAGNASTVNGHSVDKDVPSTAVFTDTDTKVTSAANHYSPSRDSSADKSASASGGSAAWSMDVVKGVTLQTDGKGHVTGINVSSGKVPANPFDPSGTYPNMTVGKASKVNNHTVDKDVPSNAVFTDTTYSDATTSASGLMSASDKSKLNGIANNANNYTHPTSSGNKHIPSGGSSGKILRWSADGTATWGDETASLAGTGISILNGVISNTGVRSVTQGGSGSNAKIFINGGSADGSSFTVEYANLADSAQYAVGASNYTVDGSIASALNIRSLIGHTHAASDITSGTFGASRLDIGMIRKSGDYFVPRMPILRTSGNVNLMTSTNSVLTAVRDNGYGTPITVINIGSSSITVTGVYPSRGTTTIPAQKSRIFTYYGDENGFFDAS